MFRSLYSRSTRRSPNTPPLEYCGAPPARTACNPKPPRAGPAKGNCETPRRGSPLAAHAPGPESKVVCSQVVNDPPWSPQVLQKPQLFDVTLHLLDASTLRLVFR